MRRTLRLNTAYIGCSRGNHAHSRRSNHDLRNLLRRHGRSRNAHIRTRLQLEPTEHHVVVGQLLQFAQQIAFAARRCR
jgi:hypothetical protein